MDLQFENRQPAREGSLSTSGGKLNLLDFPNEMICAVADHLPISSLMILRRTCRDLRSLITVDEQEPLSRVETLTLQRALARDGSFHRKKFCQTCDRFLSLGHYSVEQLIQTRSSCLNHEGVFWIMPHLWRLIDRCAQEYSCGTCSVSDNWGLDHFASFYINHYLATPPNPIVYIFKDYFLLPASPFGFPRLSEIQSLLAKLTNYPICPHLTFSDAQHLKSFTPGDRLIRQNGEAVSCASCNTSAQICYEDGVASWPGVSLKVRSQFAESSNELALSWLAGAICPPDVGLQRSWAELMIWRKDVCRAELQAKVAGYLALFAARRLSAVTGSRCNHPEA